MPSPAQLIRPGIGQNVSCTIGDSHIAHSCLQLSELWFINLIAYNYISDAINVQITYPHIYLQ